MDAFFGEIRLFPYNFVPLDWLACDGSKLSIQQYNVLYAVIGPTYGGDGKTYFNLPDLRGRTAVGVGTAPGGNTAWNIGNTKGKESVALTSVNQLPAHSHTMVVERLASTIGSQANSLATPVANSSWLSRPAKVTGPDVSAIIPSLTPAPATPDATLHPNTLGPAGSATPAPHENRQPYTTLVYCICNNGEFPSRG